MNIKEIQFSAPQPYPEIKMLQPNYEYASLMLDNMSGDNSEMSAIALYLYNHFYETCAIKNISEIFQKIAIIEMRHFNIFGTLAKKLGADPRLWTRVENKYMYWTPTYNEYYTDLYEMLCYALDDELKTIAKYEWQLKMIDEPTIQACLERIIKDEKDHVKIFEMLIQRYCEQNKK